MAQKKHHSDEDIEPDAHDKEATEKEVKEVEEHMSNDELADEQGRESFPGSDPPGNY